MPTETRLWKIGTRLFIVIRALWTILRIHITGGYSLPMRDEPYNPKIGIFILMGKVEAWMYKSQAKAQWYLTYYMKLIMHIGACKTTLCKRNRDCQCWILLLYSIEKVCKPLFYTYWPASDGVLPALYFRPLCSGLFCACCLASRDVRTFRSLFNKLLHRLLPFWPYLLNIS